MRETKTKVIGSSTYAVTQLGAIEGRRVLARLIRVVGGLVAGMVSSEGQKIDMVGGFMSMADRITPDEMEFFCETFAPLTQVTTNGKTPILKDVFDDHFAANYDEMINWLGFCLQVNFESFLGGQKGIAALFADPGKATESLSKSPKA